MSGEEKSGTDSNNNSTISNDGIIDDVLNSVEPIAEQILGKETTQSFIAAIKGFLDKNPEMFSKFLSNLLPDFLKPLILPDDKKITDVAGKPPVDPQQPPVKDSQTDKEQAPATFVPPVDVPRDPAVEKPFAPSKESNFVSMDNFAPSSPTLSGAVVDLRQSFQAVRGVGFSARPMPDVQNAMANTQSPFVTKLLSNSPAFNNEAAPFKFNVAKDSSNQSSPVVLFPGLK